MRRQLEFSETISTLAITLGILIALATGVAQP
jgi:hypothetical protein